MVSVYLTYVKNNLHLYHHPPDTCTHTCQSNNFSNKMILVTQETIIHTTEMYHMAECEWQVEENERKEEGRERDRQSLYLFRLYILYFTVKEKRRKALKFLFINDINMSISINTDHFQRHKRTQSIAQ